MMTDKEAKEYLEAVVSKTAYAGKKNMEEDCQYLDIFGKCKATTHKTCRGCRFFNPTMPAKIRILAQYGLDRDKEINKLCERLAEKEKKVDELEREIEGLRQTKYIPIHDFENVDSMIFCVEIRHHNCFLPSIGIDGSMLEGSKYAVIDMVEKIDTDLYGSVRYISDLSNGERGDGGEN